MDPVTFLVKLPVAPITSLLRLAELLRVQAEREMRDPATVRRELEETEQARAAGEISPEDEARTEEAVLGKLGAGGRPAGTREGS